MNPKKGELAMVLNDRYEVVDETHGEGGFGRISKRRDKALERFVAVKELRLLSDQGVRERFRREAKVLARLSHPNIPAIYDVQFNDDQMFIFFEFIAGNSLRQLIGGETMPPLERVRRWFTQVAAALDHAHSKRIVHRDVKPDNIVISEDHENAILVDFGIALNADDAKSLTRQGYVIGTPGYMSPSRRIEMPEFNPRRISSSDYVLHSEPTCLFLHCSPTPVFTRSRPRCDRCPQRTLRQSRAGKSCF
jgi:eukaryotic-like serine/threonine-protein kinase